MSTKKKIILLAFIVYMMFLNAISDNVRGILVPIFKGEFNLTNGQVSYVIAACFVAGAIFNFIGGIICEKFGQRASIITGLSLFTAGMGVLSLSKNYLMLILGMFLSNAGIAFMGIAINTIVPVLFMTIQGIIMNLTHFTYGVGAVLTQRIVGIAVFKGISWRNIYFVTFIASAVILLLNLVTKIDNREKARVEKGSDMNKVFLNKLLYFYMLTFGTYLIAEHGTANWFVNLLESLYKYDKSVSSFYIALFFGGLTVGRLFGGFIVDKFGHFKTVLVFLSLAFIFHFVGTVAGKGGIMLISISGLFFSIVFPTVISTVGNVFKEAGSYATGIIISAASLIDAIGNTLIGYLNDVIGYKLSFYLIPISLLLCITFVYKIYNDAFKNTFSFNVDGEKLTA